MKRLPLLLLFIPTSLWAASGDYKVPTAVSEGTNWTSWTVATINSSNDTRATYSNAGQNWATATNFSIGATTGGTVDSILVRIEGNGAGNPPSSRSIDVQLVISGSRTGDIVAQSMDKNTDNTYTLRGSTNALWNTAATIAQVNATNFGLSIRDTDTGTDELRIDMVEISVWWTDPATGSTMIMIVQ